MLNLLWNSKKIANIGNCIFREEKKIGMECSVMNIEIVLNYGNESKQPMA